jgi:homopolymeric O-antigen transport system ATP-binding protein
MSVTVEAARAEGRQVDAEVIVEQVGVRFDFDRRSRVLSPLLARIRRVKESTWGLRDVDLRLESGAGLALVGPTGSGKTTLLRLLAGVLKADEGRVQTRGRIGSLLAISVGLESLLTGRENSLLLGVLVGLSIDETRARIDEIKERSRLGDAFERTIHTYSQGMRARLHLSVIQSVSTDVLLLDEIFEALDHEFRKIVEDFARDLRERGGVVVAAGHDHAALQRICPRAMWLAEGRVVSEGPFTEVVGDYRGGDTPELS